MSVQLLPLLVKQVARIALLGCGRFGRALCKALSWSCIAQERCRLRSLFVYLFIIFPHLLLAVDIDSNRTVSFSQDALVTYQLQAECGKEKPVPILKLGFELARRLQHSDSFGLLSPMSKIVSSLPGCSMSRLVPCNGITMLAGKYAQERMEVRCLEESRKRIEREPRLFAHVGKLMVWRLRAFSYNTAKPSTDAELSANAFDLSVDWPGPCPSLSEMKLYLVSGDSPAPMSNLLHPPLTRQPLTIVSYTWALAAWQSRAVSLRLTEVSSLENVSCSASFQFER